MDRVARYHATAGPVVCDITSGLDSRLAVVAADAAGLKPALTVNGLPDDRDVRIAHQVAEALQWDLRCFDTRSLWTVEITPDVRRELLYRTSGELPFTRIYTHMLSRPRLAQDFNLHTQGSGGELFRYFPWGQELFGVGRRRLANVDNVLKYRLLKDVPPPSLFSQDWLPGLHENLRSRIKAICREQSRTRTTQQLDAIHIWKSTSHSTLYISALYNWLPTAAPLLSAGVVKVATSMPWIMRLSSQLQRHIIYALSPRAARVVSTCDGKYGGPAEPTSFKNLHFAVWRGMQSGGHLATKFERILLKGAFGRRLSTTTSGIQKHIPFVTGEFREVLAPETMLSRALYTREGLRRVLSGTDEDWQARESSITKLATIEQLCRELDFEPGGDFLASAPLERPDMPS